MNDQIAAWGLRDAGFDYNLVAVFGSQSTGKSMHFLNVSKLPQQLIQQVRSLIGCSAPTSMSWTSRSANRQRRVSGSLSRLSSATAAIESRAGWPCRCQEASRVLSYSPLDTILNYLEGRCWGVCLSSFSLRYLDVSGPGHERSCNGRRGYRRA